MTLTLVPHPPVTQSLFPFQRLESLTRRKPRIVLIEDDMAIAMMYQAPSFFPMVKELSSFVTPLLRTYSTMTR